jgi:phage head maturation protease
MITYRTTNELRQSKDGGTTVAVINSQSIDRHGTVIDPRGVDLTNYSRNPVFLINHDYNMLAGNGAVIRYQDDKLIAEIPDEAWDDEDEEIKRWKRKVKSGKMKMTSIRFNFDRKDVDKEQRMINGEVKTVPVIRKSELLEFSFVTVGSNPDAFVLQRDMNVKEYFEKLEEKFDEVFERLSKTADRDYMRALIEDHFENYIPRIRQPEPVKELKTEEPVSRSALIAQEAARQILNIKRKQGKA